MLVLQPWRVRHFQDSNCCPRCAAVLDEETVNLKAKNMKSTLGMSHVTLTDIHPPPVRVEATSRTWKGTLPKLGVFLIRAAAVMHLLVNPTYVFIPHQEIGRAHV